MVVSPAWDMAPCPKKRKAKIIKKRKTTELYKMYTPKQAIASPREMIKE
jgi:hypothetical protein